MVINNINQSVNKTNKEELSCKTLKKEQNLANSNHG